MVLLFCLVQILTSCGEVNFSSHSSSAHIIQMHQQLHVEQLNTPIDILFVIDNSSSMNKEHRDMIQRIDGFLTHLDGLDWQAGITTTNAKERTNRPGVNGTLVPLSGYSNEFILNSQTPDAHIVFGQTIHLETRKRKLRSSEEMGIRATQLAIEQGLFNTSRARPVLRSLFRPEAHLAVILISDEDESNLSLINAQNFYRIYSPKFKALNKIFTFHSIVVIPEDKECLSKQGWFGSHEYGVEYERLSQLTGGIVGSVCASDYAGQFAAIGSDTRVSTQSVVLDCAPVDQTGNGNPDVFVTYRPQDGHYDSYDDDFIVSDTTLQFANDLSNGDYQFRYECEPSQRGENEQ